MFEGYEELTTLEKEKLQEVIKELLSQTFILERKYDRKSSRVSMERDYDFCDRHFAFLKEYFEVAGIRLQQDHELGVIYIQGAENVGEKLTKLATIYFLLLKLIYDEKMTTVSNSVNIVTTLGELYTKSGEFRLLKGLPSVTERKKAFAILKKYQMIEFLDSSEELDEEGRIMIYPCINLVLMREDIKSLLETFEEDLDTEEQHEEEQNEAEGETEYGTGI